MLIDGSAGQADPQAWRIWRTILNNRERDRATVDGHNALIRGRIPAVEGVVGATTQCPGREVEPKRRTWLDQELARLSRLGMTRQGSGTTGEC